MGSEDRKLFIVGFDGAEPEMIEKWVKEGELPNIKRLMDNGSFSRMNSTPMPISPAAWTSFMTGKNPGKHGVYDFVKVNKDYENELENSQDIDSETLWDILSRHDKKVCAINIPNTYPPWKINGIMVSGFMSPSLLTDFAYPEAVEEELREMNYIMESEEVYEGNNEQEVIEDSYKVIEKRTQAAEKLIDKEDWDVFMITFTESDRISHRFWKHMDEDHPMHEEGDEKYEEVILNTYKKIDKSIGRIINSSDKIKDSIKILLSDHGFGPLTGSINLNNWLLDENYLKVKKNPLSLLKYYLWKSGFTIENMYKIVKFLGLAKYTKTVDENTRKSLLNFFLSFNDIDWEESKAFSAINFGPVFLNKERYEKGNLKEKESKKTREEIINKMEQIKDKGEKVITEIYRKEEIFEGENLEKAPDILYKAKDNKWKGSRYFEFGSNKLFSIPHRSDSGHHREKGVLIISGPGIENKKIKESEIVDVAPTILNLMNVPIPEDMDGKAIEEVLKLSKGPEYIEENSGVSKEPIEDIKL